MTHEVLNPESLGAPKGYSNGILTPAGGRMLFVAGQVGWTEAQEVVSDRFSEQFGRALHNIVVVVKAAGGQPEHIARLTIYVTNKQEYLDQVKEVGAAYRNVMGKHFPAMALVEVRGLVEPDAKVEIEATAVLPGG